MESEPSAAAVVAPCIRTLRLKVKPESYPWLNAAAIEVNQVWNYDRDVNAAKNILFAGRCSLSVGGNKLSPSGAPPSQAPRLREAGTSALTAAA
jgi:hypothetical protein